MDVFRVCDSSDAERQRCGLTTREGGKAFAGFYDRYSSRDFSAAINGAKTTRKTVSRPYGEGCDGHRQASGTDCLGVEGTLVATSSLLQPARVPSCTLAAAEA